MLMIIQRTLVASVLVALSSIAYAVPPIYTFQTGVGNDDVGDASDNFYYLTGSALLSRGMSRNSIVDLLGEVSTYEWPDNDDRTGEEIVLQGTYSYTPRAGYRVPTYSVELRHTEEYLGSDDFDASTTELFLMLSYRIDDRTNVLGGVGYGERDSSDDSEATGYFVDLELKLNPRWLLYTTFNFADEEITSSGGASTSGKPPKGRARSFWSGSHLPSEGGHTGGGMRSRTVSDDFDNTFVTLGASYVISSLNTLELSFSRREYESSGATVDGNVYSIDLVHRF